MFVPRRCLLLLFVVNLAFGSDDECARFSAKAFAKERFEPFAKEEFSLLRETFRSTSSALKGMIKDLEDNPRGTISHETLFKGKFVVKLAA